jgi:hypothetical protein
MLWLKLAGAGASSHPVDPTPVDPVDARAGMLALNPETDKAIVMDGRQASVDLKGWARVGVKVYRSHFASCPEAAAVRRESRERAGQGTLL